MATSRLKRQRMRDKDTIAKSLAIAEDVRHLWKVAPAKPNQLLFSRSVELRSMVLAVVFGRRDGTKLRIPDPRSGEEVLLPLD